MTAMYLPVLCVTCASIVALYYLWRHLDSARRQHAQTMRERVAFLLWMAATTPDDNRGTLRKV
jgi:hypothetical protein